MSSLKTVPNILGIEFRFIFLEDPGYPIVSVTSGLTNLTVMWISPPSGGSPDYFNVVLMNGTEVLYDEKNVSLHQLLFLNLLSNMLYGLQVVAINCASYSVKNLSASTCKLNFGVVISLYTVIKMRLHMITFF